MRTTRHSFRTRACAAFTMIEIAICLGVIGFALVAIIGVLPTGMNVQKENREETIINQDATVFMNAIRGGAQGLDDLTNYVVSITNTISRAYLSGTKPTTTTYWYTPTSSSPPGTLQLTNGAIILGLLSTPKIIYFSDTHGPGIYSNHVVAVFRSLSGQAADKMPQTDATMLDLAFTYRLISEVVPFCDYNTNWAYTNWSMVLSHIITTNEYNARAAYLNYVKNLTNSLYDVRLTFRWPEYPGGSVGSGRQVFRAPATGTLVPQMAANTPNPPPATPLFLSANQLYFFHPSVYAIASP